MVAQAHDGTKFGTTPGGAVVEQYTLVNANGITAKLITYGARLTELHLPDRAGRPEDVVLGFDRLEPYLPSGRYFGATIGRVANRIAGAKFVLDGHLYRLSANEGPNTLHGGFRGFDKAVWRAEPFQSAAARGEKGACGVKFTYFSPHMDEGFPGDLAVSATYTLSDRDELEVRFEATTDQPTPVNLTNHGYFNLAGAGAGPGGALGHMLTIGADAYTPVDEQKIPNGEVRPVRGTPLDFTQPTAVGTRIDQVPGGYDFNYVLDHTAPARDRFAAAPRPAPAVAVFDPASGRTMDVLTTQPGLQFYSGGNLDGSLHGIGGRYLKFAALAFEPQHFPDSVHHPNFPPSVLHPGQTYRQAIVYRFGTRG